MDLTLTYEGPVALITWNDGENRLNLDSLARLNELLGQVESVDGPCALVLTGTGKFFCNGLDLTRFGSNIEEFSATLAALERTIGRLFLFPAYTVAAINGHAFAGGALLSCSFDARIMREDRGYWCMNEADIGLALDAKLWSILEHRLARATAVLAATTARRFAGPDALAHGVVEALASEETVVTDAVALAERFAILDRATLLRHKELMHGEEAAYLGFTG